MSYDTYADVVNKMRRKEPFSGNTCSGRIERHRYNIYSYDELIYSEPIEIDFNAWPADPGYDPAHKVYYFNNTMFTPTTSKHQNLVKRIKMDGWSGLATERREYFIVQISLETFMREPDGAYMVINLGYRRDIIRNPGVSIERVNSFEF